MRWIGALVAVVLLGGAGYVLFLNAHPVDVYLRPDEPLTWPLAGVLFVAFTAGCAVVGAFTAARATTRGWRNFRQRRRDRHTARRAATVARAQHLVWTGDYHQARSELLRGDGAPSDRDRVLLLAEAHLREGEAAEARRLLEDALHTVGLDARLLDLLAEAAERSGDLRAAADALARARQAHPDSPRLARRLRDVYAAAGQWSEAVALQAELLLRVHDAGTLAAEEHVMRGLRYQAALADEDHGRAARLLLALAREDREFTPAWVSAGDLFADVGRRFTARRVWERGARYAPALALLERLERLNASEGKPERSARFYRRLARRHPEHPALPLMLARHLITRGEVDEATAVLEHLPPAAAAQPAVHALWAEVHRRRGNHSLATESYARALGADLGLVAPFACSRCGQTSDAWSGYCGKCKNWNTYRARAEEAGAP